MSHASRLTAALGLLLVLKADRPVAQTVREPALLREAGEIHGVVSFCGPQGANGIRVHLAGKSFSATTGPSGEFQLFYVPAGAYTLVVQVPGLAATTQAVEVSARQVTVVGTIAVCPDNDQDGYTVDADCNDNNPTINPGAAESCDGHDNDCDGTVDETCPTCTDADNDGFYAQPSCGTLVDCNDASATVNPTATELCDGLDNNCNGSNDEGFDLQSDLLNCGACGEVCAMGSACHDGVCSMPSQEVCNLLDDDGNGLVDDGLGNVTCGVGACQAQVAACTNGTPQVCTPLPPTTEVCNGTDDNCNGFVDEGFDLSTNVLHCGSCGHVCSFPNATPMCSSAVCRINSCNAGFFDCDGIAANGCESITQCQG